MTDEKKFVGEFESVLDHGITPEEFEKLTSFKWSERFDYLHYVVDGPFQGMSDICSFYSGWPLKNRYNEEKHQKYRSLAEKEVMYIDRDLPYDED